MFESFSVMSVSVAQTAGDMRNDFHEAVQNRDFAVMEGDHVLEQ